MKAHLNPENRTVKQDMIDALHEVLSYPNEDGKGTMLIQRIPLICKDIREINEKFERILPQMEAVVPIVKEYQERQAARSFAKRYGDAVKWCGGIILTIAGVWAIFFKQ